MVAVRKDLPSLTGLLVFLNRESSHEWLGYCQNRVAQFPENQACHRHVKFVLFSQSLAGQPGGFPWIRGF